MPDQHRNAPIGVVVGYDGSWRAELAVARAAEEAVRRRTRLAVATVAPSPARPADGDDQDEAAERALRDLVARTRRQRPGLTVTAHRSGGDPVDGLRELSERAVLLVVGAHGHGCGTDDGPGVGLGSVSRAVLRLAASPVLVVPATARTASSGRQPLVVAGVDHDPAASAVLRAAVDEALRCDGRVRLLHAYSDRPSGAGLARARSFSRDLVRELAAGAGITAVVTPEPPGVALVRHAADADVLVVSERGSALLAGEWPQSVSRAVMESLPCVVLVVTPRAAVRLVPPQRTPPPGVPRLPSARVPGELAARARARQASPRFTA